MKNVLIKRQIKIIEYKIGRGFRIVKDFRYFAFFFNNKIKQRIQI